MPDRIKRPKLSKALPRHGQIREPTIRKIRSITSPGFYTDKVLPPPRRHKGDLERIMKPRGSEDAWKQFEKVVRARRVRAEAKRPPSERGKTGYFVGSAVQLNKPAVPKPPRVKPIGVRRRRKLR